jgi:hypothetical protein
MLRDKQQLLAAAATGGGGGGVLGGPGLLQHETVSSSNTNNTMQYTFYCMYYLCTYCIRISKIIRTVSNISPPPPPFFVATVLYLLGVAVTVDDKTVTAFSLPPDGCPPPIRTGHES